MTNSPNPNANRQIWLLWLSRTGMAFGVIVLVGIAAGAWWAWMFVQEDLAPLVEKNLSETLKRPVQLGRVESFSFNGLRFGASEIPATPTDPDRASVQAIDVNFNPLQVILTRTLQLNLTLINPDLYVEQDQKNRWISTQVGTREGRGPITTQIQTVRVVNAKAVLVPNPKLGYTRSPLGVNQLNGDAEFFGNKQRIRFNLAGQMATGGNFNVAGENLPPTQQTNLQLQGQNLLAADLDRLVKLPFDLGVGRINGNLTVKYTPGEPIFLSGMGTLQDVSAVFKQLPAPFTNANGMLRFNGQEIKLENVTALLGRIPLQANGSLNTRSNFDITANVPNVAIANVIQTLKVKSPVPVVGEVQAGVRLTGPIREPLLLGQFATTKPAQVDKVQFSGISANFALAAAAGELAIASLQAKPVAGGQITGKGQIKLGRQGGVVFDAQVDNVPGDIIAGQYGVNLSPSIKIGNVSARSQIFGPTNDIRTVTRWQAPQATYPAAGEILIARGQTVLRDATFNIAGKAVKASAAIANNRWEARVQGSQLPVSALLAAVPPSQEGAGTQRRAEQPSPNTQNLPLPIQQGIISLDATLSGNTNSFKLADIQANARGQLQVAGGNVQINSARLNRGIWQASVNPNGIQLGSFEQVPPQLQNATFNNGQFTLAGTVESFQLADIQASGGGNLNIDGGNVQISDANLRNGAWKANVKANAIDLGKYAQLPPQVQSAFNGQFQVAGNLNAGDLSSIAAVGQGNIRVAGGNVQLREVQLQQGNWQALVNASGVQLARFPQVPKQLQGLFNGQVRLAGNVDSFNNNQPNTSPLSQIAAVGRGNLQLASGNIQLQEVRLDRGNLQAQVAVANAPLSNLPQVPAQLQGAFSGQLRLATNLDVLTASSDNLPLSQITAIARGNLQIAGGNVQVREGRLERGNLRADIVASGVQTGRFPQVPQPLRGVFNGELRVAGNIENINTDSERSPLSEIAAIARGNLQTAGGNIRLREAQLAEGNWRVDVVTSGVQLARLPQVPPQLAGSFTGDLKLAGNIDAFSDRSDRFSQITGTARGNLQIAAGNIRIREARIEQGNLQADVVASNVQIGRLPQVPPQLQGLFNGELQLAGNIGNLSATPDNSPLSQLTGTAKGNLQIAGGNIQIENASIEKGNWQAEVVASAVQLARLPQVPPQFRGLFSGQLEVAGNLAARKPNESPLAQITVNNASGNLAIDTGNIRIQNASLQEGNWQATVAVSNFQLGRLPQVPKQFAGVFTGELQAAGNLDLLTAKNNRSPLTQIRVNNASGNLQIAGGNVLIREAQLDRGNLQANVGINEVQLNRFSPQLKGRFSGNLNVGGNIASLTTPGRSPLPDLRADGQVNFSQGVANLDGPITASIQWNGRQLQIREATAPGLNASGIVAATFDRNNRPNISNVDLNINAQNFNLQTLPIQLPNNITLAGRVDFNGRIAGTPTAPNANGNLTLRDFVFDGLAFDPILSGEVQVAAGGGVNLRLAGIEDRIELSLDNNYSPLAFLVRRDGAEASGRKQGDLLLVDMQNFPLATLKALAQNVTQLPQQVATQPVSGQLSGNFAVNINARTIEANNVAIAQPALGDYKADSITGDFRYANGIGEITNARLQQGGSSYGLSGRITPTDFVATVQVGEGKIQNILTAFNLLNLRNNARGGRVAFATADRVQTVPIDIESASLLSQLRRFSEIQALLAQQRTRRSQTNRIPDIADLIGDFSGTITVSGNLPSGVGALPTGVQASFDLSGKNWELGNYKANQVVAQGTLRNNILTVNPIRIQSNDTLLAFSGTVGLQQQNGRVELQNFPVEVLKNFVPLPVEITGKLSGTADITGTLENPELVGNLALAGGTLNGTQVQSATAIFGYENARLRFDSDVVVQSPQPVLISGSVPYKLPFSSVQPASNGIELNVKVQNEGLALLNLLSRGQVEWRGGEGQADLQVRGTFNQPQIRGNAQLENASIAVQVLPAPLTQVTATARFDGDRIFVDNFGGNFSDGAVTAQGSIPITRPSANQSNPLLVSLTDLTINLKGLYRGGVNGDLQIVGTAFDPNVRGEVTLTNGEVFLGERSPNTTTARQRQTQARGNAQNVASTSPVPGFRPILLGFDDLKLVLDKNIRVTRQPLFSFGATGELIVNGLLNDPRPEGTIKLRRGQVNLFTTQFRLEGGYEQTAQFLEDRGLDPILNVRLFTTVPEVTGSRLPASPISSEIADVPTTGFFGSVETVRVTATVEGPASQLNDNLELRSNPPRSETEIVALIGGGFVQNLGRGDSTLGLANLAGSAFLSTQQVQGTISAIGQAIGLSELRFFPTAITSNRDDRSRNSSALGLAVEGVVDINRQISASISKILTTDQPIQYNLRYRVNDNILLRGSTDLSGDSRALIEFERRF